MSEALEPKPMVERTMLELAARGVGRVDRDGGRGITLCTQQEIEAMAVTLVCLGVIPVWPGDQMPEVLFCPLVPTPANDVLDGEVLPPAEDGQ